jgi:hypothetical protein
LLLDSSVNAETYLDHPETPTKETTTTTTTTSRQGEGEGEVSKHESFSNVVGKQSQLPSPPSLQIREREKVEIVTLPPNVFAVLSLSEPTRRQSFNFSLSPFNFEGGHTSSEKERGSSISRNVNYQQ